MSMVLTDKQVKKVLAISVGMIIWNVLQSTIQKTKEIFCTACPTPCNSWCDKATEVTKDLLNHYLAFKAKWN